MLDIRSIEAAMDLAPEAIFFVKDHSRKYLSCNRGLANMCGVGDARDILGYRTDDFFDAGLVSRYKRLDRDIGHGLTLLDRFDFLHDSEGRPVWTLYSRKPVVLRNQQSAVMGVSRRLPSFRNSDQAYRRLQRATEWIAQNLEHRIKVQEMATLCDCSSSQIQARFRPCPRDNALGLSGKIAIAACQGRDQYGTSPGDHCHGLRIFGAIRIEPVFSETKRNDIV